MGDDATQILEILMMRIPLPAELSRVVAERIAGFPAEAPEALRWLVPHVLTYEALPLHLGWTETIALRADGEVIRWSTEGEYLGPTPVGDGITALQALVDGVARYPELRAVLP